MNQARDLIITAASDSYGSQLLALLGSLRCNWPDHPPVTVYNLGLREETRALLTKAGFNICEVPPFVSHWRKHYTWKLWCMNHASAERVLWLDAGCCVLRPIPEVFEVIGDLGYFSVPNYESLEVEASDEACEGCDVSPEFREGKPSLAANIFGFAQGSEVGRVIERCLKVAMTERFIKATHPQHRHDQAIIGLMMHRDVHPLVLSDGTIYGYKELLAKFTAHGIWAVRRGMHFRDVQYFTAALRGGKSLPRIPRSSHKLALWYRMLWAVKSIGQTGARAVRGIKTNISEGVRS